ncbi:TonB family protein [Caulobacter sp. 602-2]|uniref:TonB family protein n=1 Tax=Caulobacter sp. 602-2 TaxID=2710887 RepID=A0A6G4R2R1_9CAUL|nr:energy transducer TonB [Caulobacter sp. 602-2]NGM51458.1 TonB family protein [Caulobacter sp. 602-2]
MIQRIATALAVMALACASGAAAQPTAPAKDLSGRWAKTPSGGDMAAAYPDRAMREGVGGKATLSCKVTTDGLLAECVVASSTPDGYGFDQAAMLLSQGFQMQTPVPARYAEPDARATIPIVFQAPPGQSMRRGVLKGFGDGTIVLTRLKDGETPEGPVARCGEARCSVGMVVWAERPAGPDAVAILDRAGRTDGLTLADCDIAKDGRLTTCDYRGVDDPKAKAAAAEAVSRMRAAPQTREGSPTAGAHVQIPFQWDWLIAGMKPAD